MDAAGLGGVAYLLLTAGQRIQGSLRNDLAHAVHVALNQEVLARAAAIPTVKHLERPDYQDRLKLLRNSTYSLAGSCFTITETSAALLRVVLSTLLLSSVRPVLAGLALLAVPPLFFARRSANLMRQAHDATAELTRTEHQLHELCITPGPAKETRITGAAGALDGHADQLWAQVLTARRRAQVRGAG